MKKKFLTRTEQKRNKQIPSVLDSCWYIYWIPIKTELILYKLQFPQNIKVRSKTKKQKSKQMIYYNVV